MKNEQNTQPSVARFDCEMLYERNGDARPGMTLTKSGEWVRYESHKAELRAAVESNERLTEALVYAKRFLTAEHVDMAFIDSALAAITPSGASK